MRRREPISNVEFAIYMAIVIIVTLLIVGLPRLMYGAIPPPERQEAIRVSENVQDDMAEAFAKLERDAAQNGCTKWQRFAMTSPENPRVILLFVVCTE